MPAGNTSKEFVPWNLYRCADETGVESWLAVCVTDDRQWADLCGLAGEAMHVDPSWATGERRLADRAAVDAALGDWMRTLDAEETETNLQNLGVAAGRALHPRLQAGHPHFAARGYPVSVDQPGSGPLLLEGPAFTGSTMGEPIVGPAPDLGEHSIDICERILGLGDEAIAALVAAGALDLGAR